MAKHKTGRSPGAVRNAEDQAAQHHRVPGSEISRRGGHQKTEHAREKSRRKEGKKNLEHSGQNIDMIYWNSKYVASEGTSHKYGIQNESFSDGEMAQWFRAIAILGTRVQCPGAHSCL